MHRLGIVAAAVALVTLGFAGTVTAHEGHDPPSATEAGHYGVNYANVTYRSGLDMMKTPDDRERDGPTREHLNETQRGVDMALAPADEEARWPDAAGLGPDTSLDGTVRTAQGFCAEPGEEVVNGSSSRSCQEAFVGGPVWGYLDTLYVSSFTDLIVEHVLEEDQNLLGGQSPNQVVYQVFTAGHEAVDEAGSALP